MTPLFKKISLTTTKLREQKHFYAQTLGFDLVYQDDRAFTVRAGATELEFIAGSYSPPTYHFAFNIPENKIQEALDWTQERTPVLAREEGRHIYDFANWEAHAFYFLDPEGNILEFIARHTLANGSSKPFSVDQILCISELGLATDDVVKTCQTLSDKLSLKGYRDPKAPFGSDFQAIGDEMGMFIVAKRGRVWLGSDRSAQSFFAAVVLSVESAPFELEDACLGVLRP